MGKDTTRVLVSRDFKKMLQSLAIEHELSVTELTRRISKIDIEKKTYFKLF